MSYPLPSTPSLQPTERTGQGAICGESQWQTHQYASFSGSYHLVTEHDPMGNSPHTASIHILDDYSLLNIFDIYRPAIFDGDEGYVDLTEGGRAWDRERWWYKLAHVCQRWRNVIFGSPSHLDLCLVCTYRTPVADMLAHSPPLPLVVEYFRTDQVITTKDEEGIILALEQHDRVRRVRLRIPASKLQKHFVAIDEEYPVLEYLILQPLEWDKKTALMLPKTFQAPRLRHLTLTGYALPTRSQLLTNAVGMVTLCLHMNHPDTYFQPNTLLQWVSFMPQLETLVITFFFSVPIHDVERQLMNRPIITHVTLPNLRFLVLQGGSAYAEAVVDRITAPRLRKLDIWFSKQLTFSVPCLSQFINTAANLRFDSAKFEFGRHSVFAGLYLREEIEIAPVKMIPLLIVVLCWHLDWQVSSVAQIFDSFGQILTTVEHLTLVHEVHSLSSEQHNEVDLSQWRKLLRSFSKVKTLRVDDGLVNEVSRSLRSDDGEVPLELLPELQSLTYSGIGDTGDAFKPFINACQNAGRPVTLVHPNSRPVTPDVFHW